MTTIKNYLYNTVYQIFVLLVPLVTIPYISRVLGPSGVGLNTLTSSTIQYFVLLANLGLTWYGQREIAYHREDKEELSKTFWEIETLSICSTFVSLIFFFIFMLLNNSYHIYYLAQGVLILASATDISWFFMGLENFKITVLRNFLFKIISVFLIFLLVKNRGDLLQYILILTLTTLFGNLSLWPYLKHTVERVNFRSFNLRKHILPTFALFIPQIAINVYTVLNKIMLGHMVSISASGFYDSSDKIIRMLLTLVTAFTTVMMPHVANAFVKGKKKQVHNMLNDGLCFALIVSFPILTMINSVAEKFVPWFFGEKFSPVIEIMSIESFAIVPIACAAIIGGQYLVPLNHNKEYTFSIVFGAVVNIAINLPLIRLFQANGAAFSTIISEATVAITQIIVVRKIINWNRIFATITKVIIASGIMFVVVKLEVLNYSISFFTFLIEGLSGIIVYLIVLVILKLPELKKINNFMKNK